jgi:hypothetical protein
MRRPSARSPTVATTSPYFVPNDLDPTGTDYEPEFSNSALIGDPTAWCKRNCEAYGYTMKSMKKTGNKTKALWKELKKKDVPRTWQRETSSAWGFHWGLLHVGATYLETVTGLVDLYTVWDVEMEEWRCDCNASCWNEWWWHFTGWKEGSRTNEREGIFNLRVGDVNNTEPHGIHPGVGIPLGGHRGH